MKKITSSILIGWYIFIGSSKGGAIIPYPYETREDCKLAGGNTDNGGWISGGVPFVCVPDPQEVERLKEK